MLYQITSPPTATLDKQADELGRLLKHSKTLKIQFVTVAGSYKPARARLVVLSAPERFAEHTTRVMTVICSREDAMKQSQAVKMRPEWKNLALLVPTDADAPAIDGMLLDGWDSAFLSVLYRPGRVIARLLHCAEDSERVAGLKLDGWQLIIKPNPLQLITNAAGQPWNGVPSFTAVPGGVPTVIVPRADAAEREVPITIDAPAPIQQEVSQALTERADGFLLGVTPEGGPIRLARRAMTLTVNGPQEVRQRAVLALLRRGMQAGMGIIAVVDRSLLPAEALQAWEARVRLLDVQNIADSSAIPWREIAPDLLAQAIGGPSASLPALPSRFGAVLDVLGAESLRVPAVLGLATMPGDNLRGALAAGGLVVVPQDDDAASTIVARLLLAYLATPPLVGRGLLVIADAAIVPPEALRQQAIQIVVGDRSDALLRLISTDAGWKLCGPDGSSVADLLPDLMAQPTEGAGDMVDSIVRDIGTETTADAPALANTTEVGTPSGEDDGWWVAGDRADDLNKAADELVDRVADEEPIISVGTASNEGESFSDLVAELFADDVLPPEPVNNAVSNLLSEVNEESSAATEQSADLVDDEEPTGDIDGALGNLLNALRTDVPTNATEELIQNAMVGDDFAAADATALAWSAEAPQLARPWIWRVVLTEEDTDRAVAAWRAIQIDPDDSYISLVRAVLDAMDAAEPAAWLASIGHEVSAELIDEAAQTDNLSADAGSIFEGDEVGLQMPPELSKLADWPTSLTDLPTPASESRRMDAPSSLSWEILERIPVADYALSHGIQATITPVVAAEEQHEVDALARLPAIVEVLAVMPPVVEPVAATTMPTISSAELNDDAIRAIWQSGESVPQLVARLVASGIDGPTARTRVRAIVNARPTTTAAVLAERPIPSIGVVAMQFTAVKAPLMPAELSFSSLLPINVTPMMPETSATVDYLPVGPTNGTNGNRVANMPDGEIDDDAIWQHWQAGTKTDDISIAICGKRGGPKADAARDRMYSVVIPRIVAALDCDDLVDRIAAGEPVGSDPRYPELTKRLARSESAPVGNLERSLIKRLMKTRQEV